MTIKTIEREAEIREKMKGYPAAMQRLAGMFSERRASKNGQYLVFESTCRAQDIAEEYARLATNAVARAEYYDAPGSEESSDNPEFNPNDCGWAGIGSKRLAREIREGGGSLVSHFEKAREELAKTGIKEMLEESLSGMRKRRKRVFSEHDGDWDLDRKWDSTPFQGTKSAKKEFPYIEIAFPVNMNAGASADTVARFGARCLALVEILEHTGFRVAITGEHWNFKLTRPSAERAAVAKAVGFGSDPMNENTHVLNRIIFRGPDEYGDIQGFAAYSSVEFFRRIMFATIYNGAHYVHGLDTSLRVHSGYGSSLSSRPLPAGPGVVVLNHDTIDGIFSMNKEKSKKLFGERVLYSIAPKQAAQAAG